MTDFTKLKKGDKVKVCWKGSISRAKGYKLFSIEKVEEVTETKIVVGMVVDTYRLFSFNKQGLSLGVHDYWLEKV